MYIHGLRVFPGCWGSRLDPFTVSYADIVISCHKRLHQFQNSKIASMSSIYINSTCSAIGTMLFCSSTIKQSMHAIPQKKSIRVCISWYIHTHGSPGTCTCTACLRVTVFVCLFVCLFVFWGVYRPTREFFTHIETSPLPVKGCKF